MNLRLQIGASKLEKLSEDALKVFLNQSWIHFGDEKLKNPNGRKLINVDYSLTRFQPFYFESGSSLPFEDGKFSHIYSEHFLEHLFLDESLEILRECYRVLAPGGFIRLVVPDADLRKVPEKLGFPGNKYNFNDLEKHKTRWSIYSLRPALELSGFQVIPLKNYDKMGNLYDRMDDLPLEEHKSCVDQEMVSEKRHIKRSNSLIVDGVK